MGAPGGLGVRLASAAVLAAVLLGTLFFGGVWGLAAVMSVIALLATVEFYRLVRRDRRLPSEFVGLVAVIAMPGAAAAWGATGLTAVLGVLTISTFFWHVMVRQIRLSDTGTTLFGAVYVGFSLAHLILIREFAGGVWLAFAMIAAIWANDSFAYLVGSAIGKHKMAPTISPKKSWEGLIAGTVATVAVWLAAGLLPGVALSLTWRLALGLATSVAAVVGDLAESRIKREVGAKDSGTLFPGHGGFLDRFDSFIMVAIVTFYILFAAGVR